MGERQPVACAGKHADLCVRDVLGEFHGHARCDERTAIRHQDQKRRLDAGQFCRQVRAGKQFAVADGYMIGRFFLLGFEPGAPRLVERARHKPLVHHVPAPGAHAATAKLLSPPFDVLNAGPLIGRVAHRRGSDAVGVAGGHGQHNRPAERFTHEMHGPRSRQVHDFAKVGDEVVHRPDVVFWRND